MNAGQTAERVYQALKQRVLGGDFRPGDRLDPASLASELNSSVTPVRDALHLLTGQRLVETRVGEGFHLPPLDAPGLEDLYGWNAQLLALAVREPRRRARPEPETVAAPAPERVGEATAELFARLAHGSANAEHGAAIGGLNDRLHATRLAERRVFDDRLAELAALRAEADRGSPRPLLAAIARYHRRRRRHAAEIVRALYRRG